MRIVFAGTPEFAVPCLKRLVDENQDVVAVYTQPDRRAGRGRKVKFSPVKVLAQRAGISLLQPRNLRDEHARDELAAFRPDVMVVVAYGQLLPPEILCVPRFGCINVHGSLLPRWRGAAPIARAIEAGDKVTGISLMVMDEGLDTGAVFARQECNIDESDNARTVHDKLALLGAALLAESLPGYAAGTLRAVPQDEARVSYAPKLSKEEAVADWGLPAAVLRNKIRAFNPWPVVQTGHRGNQLRILQAELPGHDGISGERPGTVHDVSKAGIDVSCGQGMLRLKTLQRAHGKPLAVKEFINGYRISPGDLLQ